MGEAVWNRVPVCSLPSWREQSPHDGSHSRPSSLIPLLSGSFKTILPICLLCLGINPPLMLSSSFCWVFFRHDVLSAAHQAVCCQKSTLDFWLISIFFFLPQNFSLICRSSSQDSWACSSRLVCSTGSKLITSSRSMERMEGWKVCQGMCPPVWGTGWWASYHWSTEPTKTESCMGRPYLQSSVWQENRREAKWQNLKNAREWKWRFKLVAFKVGVYVSSRAGCKKKHFRTMQ